MIAVHDVPGQTPMLFSGRKLFQLIFPLIIEQALAVFVGLLDSMMVSSVGETAVSGVSLVDMISILLINIFSALATGGAVVVSQYIGANDKAHAKSASEQLLLFTVLFSVAVSSLILIQRHPLLNILFGAVEPGIMNNCLIYLSITAPSYPFIALFNSASAILRAQGQPKISMPISILTNAINLCGNYVLLHGFGMGVEGVAIPTLIARAVAAVCIVSSLHNSSLMFSPNLFFRVRPKSALIVKILAIGVPNAIENGMFQFGKLIVGRMVSGFGTSQITAHAISNHLAAVSVLMGQAMCLAIVTVVGQCVGAKDLKQARHYAILLCEITTVLVTSACVLVMVTLSPVLRLFHASSEVAGYVRQITTLNCVCTPLMWAWSFVLPGALRAANDVKFTSVVASLSMWIFRVGFSYILGVHFGFGVLGVWIAMILDWIARISCYAPRFFTGRWERHAGVLIEKRI